jgi:hypothetical protein
MVVGALVLGGLLLAPRPAAAEWLLTGFVGPITGVKTHATDDFPGETFDSSTGFGLNLASAFATKGNVGFELDWGLYNKGLANSQQFGDQFASKLMSISTNLFYSPGIPRVRPYLTFGPNFMYRSDRDGVAESVPGGWAVGVNAGGGLIAFVNEYIGGRFDVRYARNIGDFVDLTDIGSGGQLWSDLSYVRVFVGATVVLH